MTGTPELSIAQKAAVVVASLDSKVAATILRSMSSDSLKRVTAEIRHLGEITPELRDIAFGELAKRLELGSNPRGGEMVARALLQDVVGDTDQADALLESGESERSTAFSAIIKVNSKDLADILCQEQPLTASIVLSYLPPEKVSEILEAFDPARRESTVKRLATKRHIDPSIVRRIEKVFVDKLITLHSSNESEIEFLGGAEFVAQICQHSDQSMEEEILGHVREVSEEVADEIRDMMFTFDDLVGLEDRDIQRILRDVAQGDLMVALKAASPEVFDKIRKNLSQRAQEGLEEEMELLGRIKRKDVEAQQKRVVAVMRELSVAGEISLGKGGDEEDEYV